MIGNSYDCETGDNYEVRNWLGSEIAKSQVRVPEMTGLVIPGTTDSTLCSGTVWDCDSGDN